jgi:hypothetical protein
MKGLDLPSVRPASAARKSCPGQKRKISREFPFIFMNEVETLWLSFEWNAAICVGPAMLEWQRLRWIVVTADSGVTD